MQQDRRIVIFWAVVRSAFGVAQMTGTVVSAVLLIHLGTARETIVAVSITLLVTLKSVGLFRWLRVQEKQK